MTTVKSAVVEILSQSAVKDLIVTIGKTGRELQGQIHQAAVSVLDHTSKYGDYTGVANLLNILPNGQRVLALAEWFRHFSDGALTIRKSETGSFVVALKKGWKDDAVFDINGAMLVTFADFTKEKAPVAVTVEKFIGSVERIANNMDDTKVTPSARLIAAELVGVYRARQKALLETLAAAAGESTADTAEVA